jgi:recombinational DNA repair ATPase RecF
VFTLVYLSELRSMTTSDLSDLLEQCRSQNQVLDITGILIHHQGHVMQLLEGEEQVVQDLYARIAADPRHHDLSVIWRSTADRRRFPDWTMAFQDLDHETQQQNYIRRRNAALQESLTNSRQLIETLTIVLHDSEVTTQSGEPASLCCRECSALTGNLTPFPCPAAMAALHDLETSSL